jgi:hypothetical protein
MQSVNDLREFSTFKKFAEFVINNYGVGLSSIWLLNWVEDMN